MKNFKRGIKNPQFIKVLQGMYHEGGWWKDVVDDKELFVAIREEYINIYYQGNSLTKLSFNEDEGNLVAETHYKYLCQPSRKHCLIKAGPKGSFFFNNSTCEDEKGALDEYLIHNLSEIDAIKKASTVYGGAEKEGIQKILNCNGNIVDLEIALTKEAEDDEGKIEEGTRQKSKSDRPQAKRIDFAAFQKNNRSYNLLFFEVKHFSNKELRAKGDTPPSVLEQIDRYRKLLRIYEKDITESYKLVCSNLRELLPSNQLDQSVINIAAGSHLIKVDVEPYLVLFGFDKDQRVGKVWDPHKDKLEFCLGKRFLAAQKPTDFTAIISQLNN